jgi:hypothetical protein
MRPLSLNAIPAGSSFSNIPFTSGNVLQIIAPSANLNGVVIRTLNLGGAASSAVATSANIYADTTAPASGTDDNKRIIFVVTIPASGAASLPLPQPIYLYPGTGLWLGSGAAVNGSVLTTYDILLPEDH